MKRYAPPTAVKFTDENGVVHDAISDFPITDETQRIDLNYSFQGTKIFLRDVPKKNKKSKHFFWQ